MKRSSEDAPRRLPVARPLAGNIMLYGNICMDMTFQVASYPKEDSSQRATGFRKQLGGNCANSCIVLSQLVSNTVQPLAAAPRKGSPGANLAEQILHKKHGLDMQWLQNYSSVTALPLSMVLLSEDSGARTIVSSRQDLEEVDVEHFLWVFGRQEDLSWLHFEYRGEHVANMLGIARCRKPLVISLEVEKTSIEVARVLKMMELCDLIFFSSDFIRAKAGDLGCAEPEACLEALAQRCRGPIPMMICAWGAEGVYALDQGEPYFQAAEKVKVVETVGAGDTFIAGCIAALISGASLPEALRRATALAGQKVAQKGLEKLGKAWAKG